MKQKRANGRPQLQAVPPTEAIDLGVGGLSLCPRLKLLLSFFRSDASVRPVDEWKLKRALLDFLHDSIGLSVPEEDLAIHKLPDLNKRKRSEPVAAGALFIRDLDHLRRRGKGEQEEEDGEFPRRRFFEWRDSVVGKTDGIELNIEGVKFRLTVEIPPSDDFDQLKKSWEDFFSTQPLGTRYSSRGALRRPDTIVVAGVPSRWFAEPRVSSKPSMLVTHTIFSVLGKIRNLSVASDDASGKDEGSKGDLLSGLHCKAWVQFEDYSDFCAATKVLCGRSMHKEGSRLKSDYEVSWDREGFFRILEERTPRSHLEESSQTYQQSLAGRLRREAPRVQSEATRIPKRFRRVD
ncbi:unnamed protein product [Spirodela intermedia]|uniref:Uncharacterized protein n=1 Tax=Spirodela intermedia TaxID=51605 RepID=A0A7I8KQR1_SPIIN|nr:unnamed protein product [Spirodela intermedia]